VYTFFYEPGSQSQRNSTQKEETKKRKGEPERPRETVVKVHGREGEQAGREKEAPTERGGVNKPFFKRLKAGRSRARRDKEAQSRGEIPSRQGIKIRILGGWWRGRNLFNISIGGNHGGGGEARENGKTWMASGWPFKTKARDARFP